MRGGCGDESEGGRSEGGKKRVIVGYSHAVHWIHLVLAHWARVGARHISPQREQGRGGMKEVGGGERGRGEVEGTSREWDESELKRF